MKTDRSRPPLPSDIINFSAPRFSVSKLDHGLKTYLVEKNNLPIVKLSVVINSGSKFDPENQKGVSNLLSLCIDEGAGNLDALELAEEFDMLGAHFSVSTDNDTTKLSLQSLSGHFENAFRLVCDVLKSPHLNEKEFGREKRKINTRLIQLSDDPAYIANTSFEYLLLGKSNLYSFPVLGTRKSLENINNHDVTNFYREHFSPTNTNMVVVGDINQQKFLDLANKYLKDWTVSAQIGEKVSIAEHKNNKLYIIDKKDSVQTEIRIGRPSSLRDEQDYYSKMLLNSIFGGQFTSRLNLNLREKHGYTYGASSRFNYYKDCAFFYISTSVGIENTVNALDQIFIELGKINTDIKDEEIKFAKSNIVKKFPSNFETYNQISSNLISKINFDLPDNFFDTYIDRVEQVSKDQIIDASQKNFVSDEMIIVLAGDKTKLLDQLKEYRQREIRTKEYKDIFSD